MNAAAAQTLILDGRGWSNKDRNSAYDKLSADQLLERLGSWSPVVRERAAMALGRRKDVSIPPLVKVLESPALYSRYGACQALIALRDRGAPAVEALCRSLTDQDLWQLAAIVLGISVLSSFLGIWKAMRVAPNEALMG